jgi:hypothetical protein
LLGIIFYSEFIIDILVAGEQQGEIQKIIEKNSMMIKKFSPSICKRFFFTIHQSVTLASNMTNLYIRDAGYEPSATNNSAEEPNDQ